MPRPLANKTIKNSNVERTILLYGSLNAYGSLKLSATKFQGKSPISELTYLNHNRSKNAKKCKKGVQDVSK